MRILVAEPDTRTGALIKERLLLWGHEIEMAETGKDATDAFQQRWFDLIVLDLNMPDMRGEAVIARMKKICLNANLLVITGKNSRKLEARIRKQGILYYMIKPLEWEGLRVIIAHIAKRKISHEKRSKEVIAMEQQEHFQELTFNRDGICVTCDNLAACGYHKKHLHPIAFCEEFISGMNSSEMGEDNTSIDPWSVPTRFVADKEINAKAYMGLCSNCERLQECRFLKPGGGTFRCDLFMEKNN